MIELLISCIASGKSTYAAKRAKEGALIINDDSLLMSMHGGNYKLYDENLKPLYRHIEYEIMNYGANIYKRDIVIDRPCLDLARRKRYISYINFHIKVPIIATCFKIEAPEEHAKRRYWNDGRGKTYTEWLRICKEHMKDYTPPTLEEGFSQIREVHYATGFMTPNEEMEARNV